MNRKTVSLFSRGPDSLPATKIMLEQGIEAQALHFKSIAAIARRAVTGAAFERYGRQPSLVLMTWFGQGRVLQHTEGTKRIWQATRFSLPQGFKVPLMPTMGIYDWGLETAANTLPIAGNAVSFRFR